MKTVTLVEDLSLRQVPVDVARQYIEIHHATDLDPLVELHDTDLRVVVDKHFVPIHRICGQGSPDVYLAYSPEVEKALGLPFKAISEQNRELSARSQRFELEAVHLRAEVSKYKTMSVWQRLRFLFGRTFFHEGK